jgi:hypothetical protein
MGMSLLPWQDRAGRFLTARGPTGKHLYREVVVVVARQNGKTWLVKPLIVRALRQGKRIMHIAHDRNLPRQMFGVIADALSAEPDLFPKRRGKVIWPRYGSGQEEIVLANGGSYRIAASRTGGARGWSNDLLIIDELREMESFDIMAAAEPTLRMSDDPLAVYLSNAGTDRSVVLNSVRDRAGKDPRLAYLEWSAEPGRAPSDRIGWAQANPALGHYPQVEDDLVSAYERNRLAGTMASFETEYLCRWVDTELPRLVSDVAWEKAHQGIGEPRRPVLGIAQDPRGRRISAALAWPTEDGVEGYVIADVDGYPVDFEAAAKEIEPHTRRLGVRSIAFSPWTDRDLARNFKNAKPMQSADWEAACDRFVRTVDAGQLRYVDTDGRLTLDMGRTVRKETAHGWIAVPSTDEQPTTASLAFIRAVWLATMPSPAGPRAY